MFTTAALFFIGSASIAAAQSLPPGVFAYGCYGLTQSGPNNAPLQICPPPPVATLSQFYYSKCICSELQDTTGFTFLYCTSFDQPSDFSFSSLCSNSQVELENTCSSINDINSFSSSACSGADTVSKFTDALCSEKTPEGKVVDVLGRFGIGRVVVGMLKVACAASPALSDVNTMCDGIDTLSTGCSAGISGGSGSAARHSHSSGGFYGIGASIVMTLLTLLRA
ncbi:hypothetical protein BDN72DRAFT_902333 [Pluteus cervinus]|uniref:Uncharacterized protein n=1 Tax=Pluteus cervinus TaxID=181527 RepID=A0ACD3AD90_9AGAR|nr:hypothetical protein BDN72DRAFT_902333 [Pluteus cervinus]